MTFWTGVFNGLDHLDEIAEDSLVYLISIQDKFFKYALKSYVLKVFEEYQTFLSVLETCLESFVKVFLIFAKISNSR